MKPPRRPSLLPSGIPPMLATLAGEPFDSPDFRFEVKWDGIRCLAFLESSTRLQSRQLNDLTRRYPDLAELHLSVSGQPAVLDGEIVVFAQGRPDFGALLTRHQLTRPLRIRAAAQAHPATYVAFDLLYWKGRNVMGYPLRQRQELLAESVTETDGLVLSRPVDGAGIAFAAAVFAHGLEGVMAKRGDSPYLPGQRSPHWRKVKRPRSLCGVIVGYTERADGGVGSVAVGLYDASGRLKPAGRAGVNLPEAARRELLRHLQALRRRTPALAEGNLTAVDRQIRWVEPQLVCRLEYLERTTTGHLRHAVFRELLPNREPRSCTEDQWIETTPEGVARP